MRLAFTMSMAAPTPIIMGMIARPKMMATLPPSPFQNRFKIPMLASIIRAERC
jgi:hypothetical protein